MPIRGAEQKPSDYEKAPNVFGGVRLKPQAANEFFKLFGIFFGVFCVGGLLVAEHYNAFDWIHRFPSGIQALIYIEYASWAYVASLALRKTWNVASIWLFGKAQTSLITVDERMDIENPPEVADHFSCGEREEKPTLSCPPSSPILSVGARGTRKPSKC